MMEHYVNRKVDDTQKVKADHLQKLERLCKMRKNLGAAAKWEASPSSEHLIELLLFSAPASLCSKVNERIYLERSSI